MDTMRGKQLCDGPGPHVIHNLALALPAGAADHWPTSQTAGTSVPPALGGATACTGPNGSFQAGSGQDDHKMKNPDPAGFGPINEGDRETSNGKPLNTKVRRLCTCIALSCNLGGA